MTTVLEKPRRALTSDMPIARSADLLRALVPGALPGSLVPQTQHVPQAHLDAPTKAARPSTRAANVGTENEIKMWGRDNDAVNVGDDNSIWQDSRDGGTLTANTVLWAAVLIVLGALIIKAIVPQHLYV